MTGTANNITYIQYTPQGFLRFDVMHHVIVLYTIVYQMYLSTFLYITTRFPHEVTLTAEEIHVLTLWTQSRTNERQGKKVMCSGGEGTKTLRQQTTRPTFVRVL